MPTTLLPYDWKSQRKNHGSYGDFVRDREMKFLWKPIFIPASIRSFSVGPSFRTYLISLWTKDGLAGHHLDHLLIYRHSIFLKSFTSIDDMNR